MKLIIIKKTVFIYGTKTNNKYKKWIVIIPMIYRYKERWIVLWNK